VKVAAGLEIGAERRHAVTPFVWESFWLPRFAGPKR
jgi:hypothetical protein